MKTVNEIEKDILNITMKIHTEFPELSKYIGEMSENDLGVETTKLGIQSFKDYYNSLQELILEYSKTHFANSAGKAGGAEASGYPTYPPSEDIYNKGKNEADLDPENPSKMKAPNPVGGVPNEKGFEDDMSGDDLDVPGAELDDQQESIGSEDEENNYYSLGGDNHSDLDESKG